MSDKICKWCGREYEASSRSASGAGGWASCSESCRLNLQASLDAGATKKNTPTSKTGRLLLVLMLVGGYSLLSRGCDAVSGDAPIEQTVQAEEVQPAERAPEAAEPEAMGTFDMPEPAPVQESQEQVEEGNTTEGEVRTIPAPEEESGHASSEAETVPAEEDKSTADPSLTAF